MSNFRDDTLWIVVAGFVACFLMAMAMGANDVANARRGVLGHAAAPPTQIRGFQHRPSARPWGLA
jgi:phosphate/sulfate permease